MPLIRGDRGAAAAGATAPAPPALDSSDAESRWAAARSLAGQAEAVPELAAALRRETVARVREAILTSLIRTGDTASAEAIVPCLRSQDARLRAAAIEALQALPSALTPILARLFNDPESDVRLLATELARNMKASDATRLLCGLIENEWMPRSLCLRLPQKPLCILRSRARHRLCRRLDQLAYASIVPYRHVQSPRPEQN